MVTLPGPFPIPPSRKPAHPGAFGDHSMVAARSVDENSSGDHFVSVSHCVSTRSLPVEYEIRRFKSMSKGRDLVAGVQ